MGHGKPLMSVDVSVLVHVTDEWPTRSKLAANNESRTAFINSLLTFLPQYGFQGVDIDWEYPVASERGGNPEDTQNLVYLVQEMHAAFKGAYGISLTLAPDYWYLRYFDAKAMESSVDFFGFMAYGELI